MKKLLQASEPSFSHRASPARPPSQLPRLRLSLFSCISPFLNHGKEPRLKRTVLSPHCMPSSKKKRKRKRRIRESCWFFLILYRIIFFSLLCTSTRFGFLILKTFALKFAQKPKTACENFEIPRTLADKNLSECFFRNCTHKIFPYPAAAVKPEEKKPPCWKTRIQAKFFFFAVEKFALKFGGKETISGCSSV